MLRSLVLAVIAFAACIRADDPTPTSEPAPTKTEEGDGSATHTVKVGFPGFDFTPNTTHAKVGDIISFKFYPPDHSVIRANFFHGCIPYEMVGDDSVGFYSGVQYLNGISDNGPVFDVRVNDTDPIFFYCGAPNSCKGKHMIGVINPNDTWTLDEHLKRVEEASFELIPGQSWPSETEKPDDFNENYNKNETSTSESASSDEDDDDKKSDTDNNHGHHLSAGAIAGIAIGSAAVLLLAGGLIYLFGLRGGQRKAWGNSRVPSFQPSVGGPFNGGHGYAGTPMMDQKAISPKMAEAWGGGPPAPAGNGYAAVPHTDCQGSPPLNGGFGPRSPPMSPQQGYGGYSGTMVSTMTSDNGTYAHQGNVAHVTPPPPAETTNHPSGGSSPPPQPPIELPTSNDPGNSPLPNYSPPRQFSWAQGAESGYRPAKS